MASEAAEVVWTRWEDRPQRGFSHRTRRLSRAMMTDPEELARAVRHAYVLVGQVVGHTGTAAFTFFPSVHIDPDRFRMSRRVQQARTLEQVFLQGNYLVHHAFEDSFTRMALDYTPAPRLEHSDEERELKLYKDEIKRLRSEQRSHERARRRSASADLDEAIAVAHPIALRLLGWLHVSGELDLRRVFEVFGASSSTFEGVARLHLLGALKFDDGKVTITSLGTRALEKLGIIQLKEVEPSTSDA